MKIPSKEFRWTDLFGVVHRALYRPEASGNRVSFRRFCDGCCKLKETFLYREEKLCLTCAKRKGFTEVAPNAWKFARFESAVEKRKRLEPLTPRYWK